MTKRAKRGERSLPPTDPRVREAVEEILTLHTEIVGLMESSLQKATRIGELLLEIKTQVPHGEFIPWINENLPFGDRIARKHMRLFDNREEIETEPRFRFRE